MMYLVLFEYSEARAIICTEIIDTLTSWSIRNKNDHVPYIFEYANTSEVNNAMMCFGGDRLRLYRIIYFS